MSLHLAMIHVLDDCLDQPGLEFKTALGKPAGDVTDMLTVLYTVTDSLGDVDTSACCVSLCLPLCK